MIVKRLIELLSKLPNQDAELWIYSPDEEISGEIRDYVKDIIEPSENKEYFILVDFQ